MRFRKNKHRGLPDFIAPPTPKRPDPADIPVTYPPAPAVYQNCNECPLTVFERCLLYQDYRALVKYGECQKTNDQLRDEVFNPLYSEYCLLSGDTQVASLTVKVKKIALITHRINTARLLIKLIEEYPWPPVLQALKAMGFKRKFEPATLQQDLVWVQSILKGDEMQLADLKKAIEKYQEKQRSNDDGKTFFDQALIAIEKHIGFGIVKEHLSVQRFCVYLKDLKYSIPVDKRKAY